jgi:hypothetical protein
MFVYTPRDILYFGTMAIILLYAFVFFGYGYLKELFCKHERTFENGQCNEICRSCRKNLGFIGRERE